MFIDEIFDARANATRNILGMLAERAHSQGNRTEKGDIETFIGATNKYLSEVYDLAGNDGPKALLDRFSFTSFVPRDFESVGSDLALMRGAKSGRGKETKAVLHFEDLEKIRALVPEVELPDHVLLFLSVLIDRYGREIENFETASLKTYQDKMRDGEAAAPPYRATKYMSVRTMGKAAGILRALVVKRWLKADPNQKPELIANLDDIRNLENFYTLNGPNDGFVANLLGKTTNPHERAQLEAIQRERKAFRDIYDELNKSVNAEVAPVLASLQGGYHIASYGSDEEKAAFAKDLAQKMAALTDRADLSSLSKADITDKTIPHFMLKEALEATALELVDEDKWKELVEWAIQEPPKSEIVQKEEVNVEQKIVAQKGACPGGYIFVPGNQSYSIQSFCVMKYAASDAGARKAISRQGLLPFVNINRSSAEAACRAIGAGYHLMTNSEWMTIARDIEANPKNWNNGSGPVGEGTLSRGNSNSHNAAATGPDNQPNIGIQQSDWLHRRTHVLSNGEVIWDMAGNVWQWVSDNLKTTKGSWEEYSGFPAGNSLKSTYGPNGNFNSKQGTGKVYMDDGGAVVRGGDWSRDSLAGVFAASLDSSASNWFTGLGFRCAVSGSGVH